MSIPLCDYPQTDKLKGVLTIERIAFIMNVKPWRLLNLNSMIQNWLNPMDINTVHTLTDNNIADSGASVISEALKTNTTLTVLNLSRKDKKSF